MKTGWFKSLPAWGKGLILGGILAAAGILFYLLDISPLFHCIEQKNGEIVSLTKQNDAYRKEILRFKRPTEKEYASWDTLSGRLRELVPRDRDVLAAARFLATYATRYSLMDVTIKMATDSAATNTLTPIAGRRAEQEIKKDAFATLGIKTYVMEMAFVASFKNSAKFLDDIAMTSPRCFQVKKAQIEKDFPFIRTTLFIRFYYGGELNVKK